MPRSAEPVRRVDGGDALDVEEERRHAPLHALRPVERDVARAGCEQVLAELALVVADRRHAADRVEVGDRRAEAGEQLVRERARLELAPDRRRGGRARLVRAPRSRRARGARTRCRDAARRTCTASRAARRSRSPRRRSARAPRSAPRRSTRSRPPRARARRCASRRRPSRSRSRRARTRRPACARSAAARGRRSRPSGRRVAGGDAHLQPLVRRELDPRRDAAVVVELRRQDLVAAPRSRAPAAREIAKSSVVMFIPNEISSGEQPRNRPASSFARARIASTARPVAYGAPRLPEASRSASAIASPDLVRHLRAAGRVEEREAVLRATRTAARSRRRRSRLLSRPGCG